MRRFGTLGLVLGSTLVTALVLAGCGDGGGGPSYDGAKEVATAAGCGSFKPDDQTTMFAAETGSCRFHGHFDSVDWFKDATSKDHFKSVADQVGGSVILYGKNFAITCEVKDDCDAFKRTIGGVLD